ncbi:polymorphic toxin type 15 domain-containing protein [Acinetobacter bereziniae]|uniref:polymorphic toxin type 15 domain-containing protein n=2 Tax=Acinetobacter bereziniae TaxID=106648 RepID=UPI00125FD3DE|nr:polymorphic toxin type 15 domain-containing protein [Acinetobacter bereziniae]
MNFNNLKKYANNIQKEIDQTIGSVSSNTEALGKFLKKKLDEIILAHSSAIDGAQDWVKQFIYGEFNDADDEKDVSVIATEMITGFLPGTTLVYSARDAVAVAMRMIKHPQKQDDLREWMLLVVYLLPFGIVATTTATGAAGGAGVGAGVGAAGAGVGAAPGAAVGGAVGGAGGAIVGSALANLVKCTALFLVKKEPSLAKIVNKLDQIVYGNVLNTLKKIKYSDYGQEITSKIVKLGNKLLSLTRQVKTLLEYAAKVNFMGAGWAKDIYKRMEMFEKALVSLIQKSASKVKQVLQEFDKQMQDLLKQTFKMEHAYATVGTKVKPVPPPSQTVRPSFPQTATANAAHTAGASTHMSGGSGKPPENVHQPKAKEPPVKKMKETAVECFNPVNTDAAKKNAAKLIKEDYPPGSKNLSVEEYLKQETDRQLKNQQIGLNEMSVDDYINGRKAFITNGRGSGAPAAAARDKYESNLIAKYEAEYQRQNIGAREAKKLAKAKSSRIMNEMAALHDPDQIAAGVNKIGDKAMGLKNTNSSIGSQWKTRVQVLDEAAAKIPVNERNSTSMNAKLKRCKK